MTAIGSSHGRRCISSNSQGDVKSARLYVQSRPQDRDMLR